MQEEGEEIYMLSMYIITITDANGVPVSEETTNVINAIKERLKEFPPEEQIVALRNCIFKEFMGPDGHGYVRTMRLGPTPSQVFGKASKSQTSIDKSILSSKLASLVKEKMESMVSTMQSQIDKLNNCLEVVAGLMEKYQSISCTNCGHQDEEDDM